MCVLCVYEDIYFESIYMYSIYLCSYNLYCVCIYIHNKYTQNTHTHMNTKTFILDAINRCPALIQIYDYVILLMFFKLMCLLIVKILYPKLYLIRLYFSILTLYIILFAECFVCLS